MGRQTQNFSYFNQVPIVIFFALQPIALGLIAKNAGANSNLAIFYTSLAAIIGVLLFLKSIGSDFRLKLVNVVNWLVITSFTTLVYLDLTSAAAAADFLTPLVLASGITSIYLLQQQFNARQVLIFILTLVNVLLVENPVASVLFVCDGLIAIGASFYRRRATKRINVQATVILIIAFVGLRLDVTGLKLLQPELNDYVMILFYLVVLFAGVYWTKQLKIKTNGNYWLIAGTLTANLIIVQLSLQYAGILNLLNVVAAAFITWHLFLFEGVRVGDDVSGIPRVSVLMPTYNSANTIEASLDSLLMQDYPDFEVIVIDDGSTDATRSIVERYQSDHPQMVLTYVYQANADQLDALMNGLELVTGAVTYILHSDDLLYNERVLTGGVEALQHIGVAGVFPDFEVVDNHLARIKVNRVKPFVGGNTTIVKSGLLFGRNPYSDTVFWNSDIFKNQVKNNYLKNNMVAWYDFTRDETLNMINSSDISFKYRIHEGNYLNSTDGSVNVLSGELRTLTHVLARHRIPAFKLQSLVFRAFNKFKLDSLIPVISFSGQTEPAEIVEQVMKLRVPEINHPYLRTILDFFRNRNNQTQAELVVPEDLRIFRGGEIRLFNRQLASGSLPDFYHQLMELLAAGTTTITVASASSATKITQLLEFFCVRDYVKVEVIK